MALGTKKLSRHYVLKRIWGKLCKHILKKKNSQKREGGPRPLYCNGLEGKHTFQKDLVKVENIAKNHATATFTDTCAHPLKEGHQETTVATPLPWNEMRTYILRRADGVPPAKEYMGPWWYLPVRACPISRVHSTKPRDLEPEDPYSKGSREVLGKRKEAR